MKLEIRRMQTERETGALEKQWKEKPGPGEADTHVNVRNRRGSALVPVPVHADTRWELGRTPADSLNVDENNGRVFSEERSEQLCV